MGTFDPLAPDQWAHLAPRIDALLDTPPDERAARLTELSGGDPVMAEVLERLLAECERGYPLLDQPAVERFSGLFDAPAPRFPDGLSERYRLTRELGRGGMATVFLARDLKHERDVAVKVMRPELALGRERFLSEIRIVAGLRHPHIVPLFDSGDVDGALYYVMPYEDGLSLRTRLARDGRLPVTDAVAVLRDVCDALVHAHQHRIVHRDIKPDNVLLSGRHAVVTDFGIAAAVREAGGRVPGAAEEAVIGTPAYMAPEQIAADPGLDHRADLYSLGVLAYELLAGRLPFSGDTPRLLAAHQLEAPVPLASLRPDVPAPLADAVMRCLAKRPEDRWQRAEDLRAALDPVLPSPPPRWRRIAMAAAIVVATGGTVALAMQWRSPAPRSLSGAVPPLSIGILPVQVSSADGALSWLETPVRQQLVAELVDVPNLGIRPNETIDAARERGWGLDTIALARDIDYFVRATFSGSGGDSVLASLELIESGIRTVRAATRRLPLPSESTVPLLVRDLLEQVRPMLGTRVHERQAEGDAGNPLALERRRQAHQSRLRARERIARGDLAGAAHALDSAAMLFAESQRLAPSWVSPPIARAALSELRALIILLQSGPAERDPIRKVFEEGLAIVDSVLLRHPEHPSALAMRGRLQWQQIQLATDRGSASASIDSAERYLRRALAGDATLSRAAADLSQLLFTSPRQVFDSVARLAEDAYRRDAFMENASALIERLALSNLELGRDSTTAFWCGEGLRRFPENPVHYGCFLQVWAWGSPLADPDSAWRFYEQLVARGGMTAAGRALYLATVAAVLAKSPRIPRDSVRAVLRRIRSDLAAARNLTADAHASHLASEAAVLFRMGDSTRARERFDELQRRDSALAARHAASRRLREFVRLDRAAGRR